MTINKTITYKEFFGQDAVLTNRLCDYYAGEQLKYVIQMLDGKFQGYGKRVEWKQRGIIPRTRNVTKAIVDKSGLLFNKAPKLEIAVKNALKPVVDETFNALMDASDWMESFQNVDVYARLLKTVIVLQQKFIEAERTTVNGSYKFDPATGDALLFTILHRGNSVVRTNPQRTVITELAFLVDPSNDYDDYDYDQDSDDAFYYRYINSEFIADFVVDEQNKNDAGDAEKLIRVLPNEDGIVPASFWYDTNKPRSGVWCEPPEDLSSLQELYNLHLTDQEYAVAWQKQKTMIINGDLIADRNQGQTVVPSAPMGHTDGGAVYNDIPLAQNQTTSAVSIGGLGTIVKIGTDDAGNPGKVEFAGPDTDLQKLDEIIGSLVENVAADWSVNLKFAGKGGASSGFQLVVEEMDGLALRERRAASAQAAMRRVYEITKALYPGMLTDGALMIEFGPPQLPVNEAEKELLWTDKINENKASLIDYFMAEQGLTKEEAMAKLQEIIQVKKMLAAAFPAPVAPTPAEASPIKNPTQTDGMPNG